MRVGGEVWDVRLDLGEGSLMIDYYDLMVLRWKSAMCDVLGTEPGSAF